MTTIHAFAAAAAVALLVTAGTGLSAEPEIQRHSVYALRIDDGAGGDFEIRLDSEELGFDVFDLADGESHEFTTDDGRPATLSNVGGELWLDVDGQLVELDWLRVHGARMYPAEGLTITGGDLDEDSKARIREALRDAGVTGEVRFASGGHFSWIDADLHGNHDVDIVMDGNDLRREVIIRREVSNEPAD